VSATDLDDVLEGLLLLVEGGAELLESGDEGVGDFDDGGDVHGSREAVEGEEWAGVSEGWRGSIRVVGGLGHVDVVVGVNGLLRAELTTEELDSAVGDDLQESRSEDTKEGERKRGKAHLVDVHVGLCSRSGLEDDKGEVVLTDLARDDLRTSTL
jgi:hypothetical protein